MQTIQAIVKDTQPNESKPGFDLYLPESIRREWQLAHRDRVALELDEGDAWEATVGIKPPNPPYLHRPVTRPGERMSLRDWLYRQGARHGATVELGVAGPRRLRWLRVLETTVSSPPRQPASAPSKSKSEPPSTSPRATGSAAAAASLRFPFGDPGAVKTLAERDYWELITRDEATAECEFERLLSMARDAGALDQELFVRLARWKSPRPTKYYQRNTPEAIRHATSRAFRAHTDAEAIRALTVLDGVAVRTATALLHWMRPSRYPILDYRVVSALGEAEPRDWNDLDYYSRIAHRIRTIAADLDVDLRTLDRALWAWQKRHSGQ